MKDTKGIVLIIVLLFLSLLATLALGIMSSSVLETKMSLNYQNKTFAFYRAEAHLGEYEQKIAAGLKVPGVDILDDKNICGVTFFRIPAAATYYGANSAVQSTFAKVGDTSHCHPKPTIKQGRQSFILIY